MRPFLLLIPMIISTHSIAGQSTDRLNKNGVALCEDRNSKIDSDCYDPVSYVKANKAEKVGLENSKNYRFKYKEATYVFTSQEHLDLFKKNPDTFVPQFGGWCAYAVAVKKEKVDIDPKSFYVQDGRVLLFYDSFFAHTRKSWLSDRNKDANTYLKEADANWPQVESKEP